MESFYCPICSRNVPKQHIEKHHLVPKCKKGKETELVCCDCHDMIHQVFTEKQLEREYNNINDILMHEKIIKWIKWIKKKPNHFRINMKKKKRR